MHIEEDQKGSGSLLQTFLRRCSIGQQFDFKTNTSQRFGKDAGQVLVVFDDQGQVTHRFLHLSSRSSGTTRGRVILNVVPASTLLFTSIVPFIKCTSCLTMDRPSPNPPWT